MLSHREFAMDFIQVFLLWHRHKAYGGNGLLEVHGVKIILDLVRLPLPLFWLRLLQGLMIHLAAFGR